MLWHTQVAIQTLALRPQATFHLPSGFWASHKPVDHQQCPPSYWNWNCHDSIRVKRRQTHFSARDSAHMHGLQVNPQYLLRMHVVCMLYTHVSSIVFFPALHTASPSSTSARQEESAMNCFTYRPYRFNLSFWFYSYYSWYSIDGDNMK